MNYFAYFVDKKKIMVAIVNSIENILRYFCSKNQSNFYNISLWFREIFSNINKFNCDMNIEHYRNINKSQNSLRAHEFISYSKNDKSDSTKKNERIKINGVLG